MYDQYMNINGTVVRTGTWKRIKQIKRDMMPPLPPPYRDDWPLRLATKKQVQVFRLT